MEATPQIPCLILISRALPQLGAKSFVFLLEATNLLFDIAMENPLYMDVYSWEITCK